MGTVASRFRPLLVKVLRTLREHRWIVLVGALFLAATLLFSWFVSLATRPLRQASPRIELSAYGHPDVLLSVTYPTTLSPRSGAPAETRVTLSALALAPEATAPLDIALTLPNDAVSFVDATGAHTSGRLTVTPGYPDALPYDIYIQHGNTQLRGDFFRAYRVTVVPTVLQAGRASTIDELAFRVRLTSLFQQAARGLATALLSQATPYLLVGALLAVGAWATLQLTRRRRLRHEQLLATTYGRLREQIKLQRWTEARSQIERLRLESPHYRDIDQLDTVVSAAETASWRREQLYKAGIEAYRQRDWPPAVQSFSAIEQETPYYRDVRFLRRTAALYADLSSRDRSRRITAARELGEVADLVDMQPLIAALGDPSAEVSEATHTALRKIGIGAVDDLLGGLVHGRTAVREGSYHLLEKLGQAAREPLLGALHSSDPEMARQSARLLVSLGARKELADALLWAPESHLDGLVQALQTEGNAAAGALVETLLQAPAARRPVVLNALAALKHAADVDRRLEEALRGAHSAEEKALLERALAAQPSQFSVPPALSLPPVAPRADPAPVEPTPARRRFLRRSSPDRIKAAGDSPYRQPNQEP